MQTNITITNQPDLRAAFWERFPEIQEGPKSKRQNSYPCDTRQAWCDFVDSMERSGDISRALANRATL